MEKTRVTKKLESTKEHLRTIKQQYEAKIARLESGEVSVPQQTQRKRKKRSKKAATNCNLEANTKSVLQNDATPTNKDLIGPQEAPSGNRDSPNPISKKDGHSLKKSDVGNINNKNKKVFVQKR